MMIGVAWALVGYVLCEFTHRGKIATTVVTAVAGAAGVGAHTLNAAGAGGAVHALAAVVIVLAVACAVAGVVLARPGRRRDTARVWHIAHNRQACAPPGEQTGEPLNAYGGKALARRPRRRGGRS